MTRRRRTVRRWAVLVFAIGWSTASGPWLRPGLAQSGRDVLTERDIVYESASRRQVAMNVFRPAGIGPFPAVELIHGGGFVAGNRNLMNGLGRWLAGNGFVAFTIDYRLAPRFPFPAAVDDAQAAIRYVRTHASGLHVDPARMGALGGSAGATLAASVATSGHGPIDRGTRVAAFVGWSGVYDFVGFQRLPPGSFAGLLANAYLFERGTPATSDATTRAVAASPALHVGCDTPPGFVANSRHDLVPLDQAQNMRSRLERAGVPNELFVAPTGHALGYSAVAKAPTLAFLDRYVRDHPRHLPRTCSGPPSGPTGVAPGSTGPVATGRHRRPAAVWAVPLAIAGALAVIVLAVILVGVRRTRTT